MLAIVLVRGAEQVFNIWKDELCKDEELDNGRC